MHVKTRAFPNSSGHCDGYEGEVADSKSVSFLTERNEMSVGRICNSHLASDPQWTQVSGVLYSGAATKIGDTSLPM